MSNPGDPAKTRAWIQNGLDLGIPAVMAAGHGVLVRYMFGQPRTKTSMFLTGFGALNLAIYGGGLAMTAYLLVKGAKPSGSLKSS